MPEPRVSLFSPDDDADVATWNAFTAGRADARGYHRMEWLGIIREAFGHRVFPLAACRGRTICGALPLVFVAGRLFGRFLVSLPFVNYGGLLADDSQSRDALLEEAGRLMVELKAQSVELRHHRPLGTHLPARSHKVSMLLPLTKNTETLWAGFKDKVRNQVRKARKSGLTATEGGLELLDEFYGVFCANMRALGTPVYGRIFFQTILRRLPEETSVISVRQNNRCLAAGILYSSGPTAEMPWASSLPAFRPLNPNMLLYWEAISRAAARGHSLFDFGRSSRDSGPWRFKRQWGAQEMPLYWEYLLAPGTRPPVLEPQNPKFRLAISLWKRLPLALTNFLGPRIVRCIP